MIAQHFLYSFNIWWYWNETMLYFAILSYCSGTLKVFIPISTALLLLWISGSCNCY